MPRRPLGPPPQPWSTWSHGELDRGMPWRGYSPALRGVLEPILALPFSVTAPGRPVHAVADQSTLRHATVYRQVIANIRVGVRAPGGNGQPGPAGCGQQRAYRLPAPHPLAATPHRAMRLTLLAVPGAVCQQGVVS